MFERWYNKEYIILFAVIILVTLYKLFYKTKLKKGGILFPYTSQIIKSNLLSIKSKLVFLPDILRLISLALLVLASMRPQWGIEKEQVVRQGIDIMIVLDVSGSMAAEDFKPNRIEAAKAITEKFITGLKDHRIGLVIFSGISLTQCPLTLDYGVVTELLRRIQINTLKIDGTAIGDGIINAVYKLKKTKGEKRDQIIILLSDGENNAGVVDPLNAAKIAAERGIKIYTIGIGSLEGAPIPIDTPFGRKYARNPDGSLLIPKVDEQTLKDIAYITNGNYFRATDEKALEKIYEIISNLEKGKIESTKTITYSEKFQNYALSALILLLLEAYLRTRIFLRVF